MKARMTNWGNMYERADSSAYSEVDIAVREAGNTVVLNISKGNGTRDKCQLRLSVASLREAMELAGIK